MITICGKRADKLFSRGFGKRKGKCIQLSWEEAAYLSEKSLIEEDFKSVFLEASAHSKDFDIRFLVYRDLRDRGYVLSVEGEAYRGRKNYSMLFYPVSSLAHFNPQDFLSREFPLMLSVVDLDGEITYYMVELHEPRGSFLRIPERGIEGHHLGSRFITFEPIEDYQDSSYGKSEGSWGHLSSLEASYLAEKGLLDADVDNSSVYRVYRDLRERGLIVKSGFKYGTHFRVYEKTLGEHSKYLVHVIEGREEVEKVSRAVRVSHAVRKSLLLAYPFENIVYFKFSWVRP